MHTDASVYHQRVGTAHRCKGGACSFNLCVLHLWKKVKHKALGRSRHTKQGSFGVLKEAFSLFVKIKLFGHVLHT